MTLRVRRLLVVVITTAFLGGAFPAGAANPVSAEFPTAFSDLDWSLETAQWAPSVASDGTNSLVVWMSDRGGVWAARVDASGALIDQEPIAVTSLVEKWSAPDVTFDGSNFLVVWVHVRGGIRATRVTPAGDVLDGNEGFLVDSDGFAPDVASDGEGSLVTWFELVDTDDLYDVRAARVSPSGIVLDVGGFLVAGGLNTQKLPAVAFGGGVYLVVWEHEPGLPGTVDVRGRRISRSGSWLDDNPIVVASGPTDERTPAVAYGSGAFLVAWDDHEQGIRAARVSPEGPILAPGAFTVLAGGNAPAVASTGEGFEVVWNNSATNIYSAPVSSTGVVGAVRAVSLADDDQHSAAVAPRPGGYFVVWTDNRPPMVFGSADADIYGARIDSSGEVLDPDGLALTPAASPQRFPAAASDGTNYLVVWEETRSGDWNIHASRLSPSGQLLDPGGIVIAAGPDDERSPAVAFDGSNYLIVWEAWRSGGADLYGARVSPTGVLLDPGGSPLAASSSREWEPAVASTGSGGFLLVWTASPGIHGALISASGTPVEAGPIVIEDSWVRSPAVAASRSQYLVAWEEPPPDTTMPDIVGRRVDPTGNVLDAMPLPLAMASGYQEHPSVASDGAGFLVAWSDRRNVAGGETFATRVSGGTVLDPDPIRVSGAKDGGRPAAAFDGHDYLVAWSTWNEVDWTTDIALARVALDGSVRESPFAVAADSDSAEELRATASRGDKHSLIVYERFAPEWPWLGATRAFVRFFSTSAESPPADTAPPETNITSRPSGAAASTSASFSFSASEPGAAFECSLDEAAFSACSSPMDYSGLAQGPHSFRVRAKDAAGNVDPTPASHAWVVDTVAPETRITSGPARISTIRAATFSFSASERDSTFECVLDRGDSKPCASPKTYARLAPGPHVFRVRATDSAGNADGSPAARRWTVAIVGTRGNDRLRGTADADVIYALGGADVVYGFGGNDLIYGGDGGDRLIPGAGSDRAYAGPGRDVLFTRDGIRDVANGGAGRDRARRDRRADYVRYVESFF